MQHEEIKQIVEEIIRRIGNALEDFNCNRIYEKYERFAIADDVILYVDMPEYIFLGERSKSISVSLYRGSEELAYKGMVFSTIKDVEDCMLEMLTTHADLFEEVV